MESQLGRDWRKQQRMVQSLVIEMLYGEGSLERLG